MCHLLAQHMARRLCHTLSFHMPDQPRNPEPQLAHHLQYTLCHILQDLSQSWQPHAWAAAHSCACHLRRLAAEAHSADCVLARGGAEPEELEGAPPPQTIHWAL